MARRPYAGEMVVADGDSITLGGSTTGNYRYQEWKAGIDAGFPIINSDGPIALSVPAPYMGHTFTPGCAGFSGDNVNDLAGEMPAVMATYHPAILQQMVGINDAYGVTDAAGAAVFAANLRTLILFEFATNPNLWLIQSTITPCPPQAERPGGGFNDAIILCNTAMGTMLTALNNPRITFIDCYAQMTDIADWAITYYPTSVSSNNIHPNATGYTHLAPPWLAALQLGFPNTVGPHGPPLEILARSVSGC